MSEWHPTETAPVTLPEGRPAHWMLIWWDGRCLIACREASGSWTAYSGECLIAPAPTHWMPLPAPPESVE